MNKLVIGEKYKHNRETKVILAYGNVYISEHGERNNIIITKNIDTTFPTSNSSAMIEMLRVFNITDVTDGINAYWGTEAAYMTPFSNLVTQL